MYIREKKFKNKKVNYRQIYQVMVDGKISEGWCLFKWSEQLAVGYLASNLIIKMYDSICI